MESLDPATAVLLGDLPAELLGKIVQNIVEIPDLINLERVSKKFRDLTQEFCWVQITNLQMETLAHPNGGIIGLVNGLLVHRAVSKILSSLEYFWIRCSNLSSLKMNCNLVSGPGELAHLENLQKQHPRQIISLEIEFNLDGFLLDPVESSDLSDARQFILNQTAQTLPPFVNFVSGTQQTLKDLVIKWKVLPTWVDNFDFSSLDVDGIPELFCNRLSEMRALSKLKIWQFPQLRGSSLARAVANLSENLQEFSWNTESYQDYFFIFWLVHHRVQLARVKKLTLVGPFAHNVADKVLQVFPNVEKVTFHYGTYQAVLSLLVVKFLNSFHANSEERILTVYFIHSSTHRGVLAAQILDTVKWVVNEIPSRVPGAVQIKTKCDYYEGMWEDVDDCVIEDVEEWRASGIDSSLIEDMGARKGNAIVKLFL